MPEQTATLHGAIRARCIMKATVVAPSFVGLQPWDGPYQIYPEITRQDFDTSDKRMTADLSVMEIPYHEVSNEFGKTAIIGGISNGS